MPITDPARLEDCRFAVRRALYARHPAPTDVDTLKHQLARWNYDFTPAEIIAALTFLSLMERPQVGRIDSLMGANHPWVITAAGMVAYESNQ